MDTTRNPENKITIQEKMVHLFYVIKSNITAIQVRGFLNQALTSLQHIMCEFITNLFVCLLTNPPLTPF
jgi:hypothetical protein